MESSFEEEITVDTVLKETSESQRGLQKLIYISQGQIYPQGGTQTMMPSSLICRYKMMEPFNIEVISDTDSRRELGNKLSLEGGTR